MAFKDKKILLLVDVYPVYKNKKKLILRRNVKKKIENIKKIIGHNIFDEILLINSNKKEDSSLKCIRYKKENQCPSLINKQNVSKTYIQKGLSLVNRDFINDLKKVNDGILPSKVFLCGGNFVSSIYKIMLDLYDDTEITPYLLKKYTFDKRPINHDLKTLKRQVGYVHILNENVFSKNFERIFLLS